MMRRVAVMLAAVLLAAEKTPIAAPPSSPAVLRVVATDYALSASAPRGSGMIAARLVNHGHEMHHLEISPVPDSLSLGRYYEFATGSQPSPLVRDIGGPNLTAPGDSSEVLVYLRPGRYVLTCWVNAADGKPHIMRGMMSEVRVGAGSSSSAPLKASVVIRAKDYEFDILGQLRAGTTLVAFENAGPQEHDIQFVRLAAGQSVETIKRWAEKGGVGAPTSRVVGGSTGIDKGQRVWFTLRLTPGRYALFCFVPDVKDGKMHLLHGMVREVTIT